MFFQLVYFKAVHVTFNTVGSQSTLLLYTQHLRMVGFVSVLFARCEASVKELGVLVNRLLTNFNKATEILSEHFYNAI